MNLEAVAMGVNYEVFSENALKQHQFVLVEFYTAWSGASHIMAPVIKEINRDYSKYIKIFRIDYDKEQDLARKLRVSRAPTYLIFRNGKLIEQIEGIISKKVLQNKIKILIRNYSDSLS